MENTEEADKVKTFNLEMTELQRLRLENAALKLEKVEGPIRRAIEDGLKQEIREAIIRLRQKAEEEVKKLLEQDAKCVAARDAQQTVLNQTLDELEEGAPDGYAITNVDAETGIVTATYAPEQRGKRLKV